MAATTPSPSGRRHLKTLSLSSSPSTSRMSHTSLNQSPSSASAASASASVGAAASPGPPATSTSTSTSHNPLRLSLRSSTSSSTRDDAILEDAPWTAPMPDTDSHQTSTNSSSSFPTRHTRTSSDRKSLNRLSLSSDISSASSSRSALRSSWGSSQLDQGPGPDSPSSLAAKKANRRQSSISYTRDPSTFTAAPWSAGSTATSASSPLHQHVQASPSPLASHRSSLDNTPASAAGDVPEGPQTPSKATGATLVEQHADLLSFIAKKERKCLDLREELKRHEDELKGLKKKWETIVARDQLQPSGNTSSSSASSPNISRSPLPATAAATPPSASPSLPSGAFDGLPPSSSIPGGSSFASASRSRSSSEDNNGPDVAAATKRWMGGWMKQGMAGVSGIIEGMAEPRSSSDGSLGTVREEEEDESHHGRPPVPRKDQHHRKDDILVKVDEHDDQRQPDLRSSQDSGMSAEGPPSANKDFKTLLDKQNRRKSAFDMGSWGDALKTSKKAALGFVETFERTLADSLVLPPGEDSPGGTSPRSPRSPTTLAGSDLLFDPSSATTLSPGSPRPHSSRSRTPSPRHSPGLRKSSPQQSFNWDAALDESSGDISAEPLQQQQQQPQSQNGRLNMAREKRAKRQTSPASGSAFAAFKDDPKEETDGWGW